MKILFISAFQTPFIQDDIELLEKHFTVKQQIGSGILAVAKIIIQSLTSQVVFCWFASVYAFVGVFLANLFGLKSVVVVGGVDVAKDEELGYGIWLTPWKAKLVRYVFHHATHIIVVDPTLKTKAIKLAEYDGKNITYLPTGYNSAFWKQGGEKENSVLTVAVAMDNKTFRLKGIDILVDVARNMPDINFIIAGIDLSVASAFNPTDNIRFLSKMPREKLLPLYQKSKVYCQPSRHEGLPNALCEAMLCGCIPVCSDVGGNSNAIGDAGFIVPYGNRTALMVALRDALSSGNSLGIRSRARIVSLFPKEKRETDLVRLIQGGTK